MLVYDNHKADRLGRRLPITESTAQLITDQKASRAVGRHQRFRTGEELPPA
ncbi:hypothetical protein BH20ACT8_BH20ACT8_02140 [soil metagenome]